MELSDNLSSPYDHIDRINEWLAQKSFDFRLQRSYPNRRACLWEDGPFRVNSISFEVVANPLVFPQKISETGKVVYIDPLVVIQPAVDNPADLDEF